MATDTVIEKQTKTTSKSASKNEEPGKFKVIVCNDDTTPIEFVVAMLISVFRHDQKSALELTLKIHNAGSAVAGIYSYEVAEQKGIDATNLARANGHPLIIKVEPE
jgi:ATP-dependent Clp protease adaptor protein ClpS